MNAEELLDQIKQANPEATVEVLQGFIVSTLYQDYKNEIIARIEQMRDFNESCTSKEYLETRGGIKALRLVMTIFDDILVNRTADLESKQTEEKDYEEAV